jgi:DDE domain
VQRRRDKTAAVKLMRKLLKKHGFAPDVLVTDQLRSYAAAKSELRLTARHERACGETIGPRIRTCRSVDASGRCSGSNRPDQRNGSYPFMPRSRTRSTSNAISFPAIRSALSEAKRFRIGGRRLRLEQEPSPSTLVRPEPSSRDNPLAGTLPRSSALGIQVSRRTATMIGLASPLFIAGELLLGFSLTVFVGAFLATVGDRYRSRRP